MLERVHQALAGFQSQGGALVWFSTVDPRTGDPLPGASRAAAIIDFEAWRCLIDYGAFAQLFDGARLLSGTSDSRLDEFVEAVTPFTATPLTLFGIVEGAASADLDGSELLDGHTCDRLLVICDLCRTADDHRPISAPHLIPDPSAVRLHVWLDREAKLRRLRWQPAYQVLGPNRLLAEQVDPIGAIAEPQMDWALLTPLREEIEDVELTAEEREEFDRLVETIERLELPDA